jgi:hypothetical protein
VTTVTESRSTSGGAPRSGGASSAWMPVKTPFASASPGYAMAE